MTDLALRFHGAATVDAAERPVRNLPTLRQLASRFIDAVSNAKRRQDEAAVAHLIIQNGGVFSDELERRISRHLGA